MTTFVCIHAGGHRGTSWQAVSTFLEARGHACIAPDLPSDDSSAGWDAYVAAVEGAVAARGVAGDVVVVGHSLGGVIAGEVSRRVATSRVIYLCAALGTPGMSVIEFARESGILPELRPDAFDGRDMARRSDEEWATKGYHDAPPEVAKEAIASIRGQARRPLTEPIPSPPSVPITAILTSEDRLFDSVKLRDYYRSTLGVDPLQIPGGHFPMASRPELLAVLFEDVARADRGSG